jgi:maltose alpha-D-glucosyltransferase/alpha-amylase
MLGDVAYVPPPRKGERVEPVTLAVAQTFVANVGDGWGHALADLRMRFDTRGRSSRPSREPYDVAMRTLGRTTAEMHLALASEQRDPAFAPEPIDDDDREKLATGAAARLVEVVEWIAESMDRWPEELRPVGRDVVKHAPGLADRLRSARQLPEGLSKIRIHGDLHLGQVLRVHEDDGRASWTLVDFEGEPMRPLAERRAKVSPLRDVAGMLRSFDYAAFAAVRDATLESKVETPAAELQAIATAWRDAARRAFLDGWLGVAAASEVALVPKDARTRDDALAVFELDKALYELAYEIENRPDWIAIPLRGIHALVSARA